MSEDNGRHSPAHTEASAFTGPINDERALRVLTRGQRHLQRIDEREARRSAALWRRSDLPAPKETLNKNRKYDLQDHPTRYGRNQFLQAFMHDRNATTLQGQPFTLPQIKWRLRQDKAKRERGSSNPPLDSGEESEPEPAEDGSRDKDCPNFGEPGYERAWKLDRPLEDAAQRGPIPASRRPRPSSSVHQPIAKDGPPETALFSATKQSEASEPGDINHKRQNQIMYKQDFTPQLRGFFPPSRLPAEHEKSRAPHQTIKRSNV